MERKLECYEEKRVFPRPAKLGGEQRPDGPRTLQQTWLYRSYLSRTKENVQRTADKLPRSLSMRNRASYQMRSSMQVKPPEQEHMPRLESQSDIAAYPQDTYCALEPTGLGQSASPLRSPPTSQRATYTTGSRRVRSTSRSYL